MKTLKNGPLAAWKQVLAGQVLDFMSSKPRHVKFQVTANSPLEIWAATDKDMTDGVLIGCADEKLQVEYTASSSSFVMIKAEKKTAIFVNCPDLDQAVPESEKPSFTSIEPRVRKNTEFDRMLQYVKLNETRREAELAKERQALRAEFAAQRLVETAAVVEQDMEPISDVTGAEAPS